MKSKKQVSIYLDENLFSKIEEMAGNDKSINNVLTGLIKKGLSKNQNEYRELLNFLSKNIVTKINKEFTDYRFFLRKFLLNNSESGMEKPEKKKSVKEAFFDKISQK